MCLLESRLTHTHAHTHSLPPHDTHTHARLPAYQRYHALAQPAVPPPTTPTQDAPPPPPSTAAVELPLPYTYQLLEEKFRCADTVVSMLQKRKEICTFEKMKTAVQEMSRRYVGVVVTSISIDISWYLLH